jgi:DNA-binding transcriptional ArsR family regulator
LSYDRRLVYNSILVKESKYWRNLMPRTLPDPSADSLNLTVILSALAEPGRRALMTALYNGPEPIECADLAQRAGLGLTDATISHHYRVLREAGLTRTVVEGRRRLVSMRRDDAEARFPGLLQAVLTDPDTTRALRGTAGPGR